jgi:ribosomal protein S3
MRAVKKVYSFSHYKGKQVPVQTLNLPIDYSLTEAYTFAGVLGIKVWIG